MNLDEKKLREDLTKAFGPSADPEMINRLVGSWKWNKDHPYESRQGSTCTQRRRGLGVDLSRVASSLERIADALEIIATR